MLRALAALVLLVPAADHVDLAKHEIEVTVGTSVLVTLPKPAQGICDDTSLVRVEDATTALRVVGLAAGHTRCGFWFADHTRALFTVTVRAAAESP
jgi:hypothetical protein